MRYTAQYSRCDVCYVVQRPHQTRGSCSVELPPVLQALPNRSLPKTLLVGVVVISPYVTLPHHSLTNAPRGHPEWCDLQWPKGIFRTHCQMIRKALLTSNVKTQHYAAAFHADTVRSRQLGHAILVTSLQACKPTKAPGRATTRSTRCYQKLGTTRG